VAAPAKATVFVSDVYQILLFVVDKVGNRLDFIQIFYIFCIILLIEFKNCFLFVFVFAIIETVNLGLKIGREQTGEKC
jgi:hypothetical protein